MNDEKRLGMTSNSTTFAGQRSRRLANSVTVLAAMSFFAAGTVCAADDGTVAQLQAEIARLKQELAKSEQERAAQKGSQPAAPDAAAMGAATPSAGGAAAPQEENTSNLDKVVVRRAPLIEQTHDVPVSTSVVSGAELSRELAQDLSAFTKRTANITFNQNNTRGASISIRGLGKRAFAETEDPSVLVVVDGVSYGLTELGNFDFYDVASVEVARGPQGTLGGKGASAGVLTVTSRAPSFKPEASYDVTYGERDTVIANASFSNAVIDDLLAWRGSLHVDQARGYYVDAYNDRGNYTLYNKDRVAARTQFLLTPSPDVTVRVSGDFEPRAPQLQNGLNNYVDFPSVFADGSATDPNGVTPKARLVGFTNAKGVFFGPRSWFAGRGLTYGNYINSIVNSGTVNFDATQGQFVSEKGGSVQVDWTLGEHTLTSISAHRNFTFDARNDEGTPFDISKSGGGGVFYRQYSEELRDSARLSDFLDYQAGLFEFDTRDTIVSKSGFGSDAGAWYATNAQYNRLEGISNSTGLGDPTIGANRGAGGALLRDSLADVYRIANTFVTTQSDAIFGKLNWHFSNATTLATGLRIGREHRSTEDDATLVNNGIGAALNPVATSRGYQLGGFASDGTGGLLAGNSLAQLSLADSVANGYFGAPITATPGAAYGSLTPAQKAQVAAAKAVRAGQLGPLITGIKSYYTDTLYGLDVSPSHKFNENFTGYTTWQRGEKSGAAQNVNGATGEVRPEVTNSLELGLKSVLLNKTLYLNTDLFLLNIRDYQQAVRVVDTYQTQLNIANGQANPTAYASAQGNVSKVRVKGWEFDASYTGIRETTVRVSGAYNDARYVDYKNAAKPVELSYLTAPYIDESGKSLPGAPKWTVNVGAEYALPIFGDKLFHASFNTVFTSRYENDDTLSDFGWIPGHALTDASIGIGNQTNTFDVNFVVKNLADNRSHEQGLAVNSGSYSGGLYYEPYPYPRWWGVQVSGKL